MVGKESTGFTGKKIIFFIFFPVLFLLSRPACATNGNYPAGSRSAAMGNASVAISDLWSLYHNQAGLASITSFQIGVHHENRFMVPEFALQALALALPVKPGTIGLGYSYFGFSAYNESKLGLAFGRMFGENFSAGIRINYLHTYIAEDYGNAGNVTVEGGFIAQPAKGFFIAAHVYNPTRTSIKTYYDEPVPAIFRFGIAGYAGDKLLVTIQAEKELNNKPVFRAGLEMGFREPLYLRAGITSEPVQGSFGLGYIFGRLSADLAFTNHQILGFTPHFSLSYRFR